MEKKELNLRYLLEETIKKAYEKKDCLFLARLILITIEQNPDIKIDLDLKTLDWVIFDRMVKTLEDIDYEENLQGEFYDISDGVINFVKFIIQRKKEGKL